MRIMVKGASMNPPSQHFAGHLPRTSALLRAFATGLIDGHTVTLTNPLDVLRSSRGTATFAQFAVFDTGVGETRAFVIAFQARTEAELNLPSANRDQRGIPSLLDDFHSGLDWEAYNCHIVDFQVYSRASLYAGKWPQVPQR